MAREHVSQNENAVAHTPGPWSVRYTSMQDGKGGHCSVSIYKGAKNIFAKRVQGRLTLEDEANAALIAAAPDMLEACIRTHDALLSLHVCNLDQGCMDAMRGTLRAAIAKAKGEA